MTDKNRTMENNREANEERRFPPPWDLKGTGYILVYRFANRFSAKEVFCPDFFQDKPFSGFGAVMIVDYEKSNAGPYKELLFIPGKFSCNGEKRYSITKIYVSSRESLVSGRQNWGIPKESADFSIVPINRNTERITVIRDDRVVADMTFKTRALTFPVTTALYPLSLIHVAMDKKFFIRAKGKGWARPAKLARIVVDKELFPDISRLKPFMGIKVSRFSLHFPIPKAISF
jgi:acetoacetate decarboxylase